MLWVSQATVRGSRHVPNKSGFEEPWLLREASYETCLSRRVQIEVNGRWLAAFAFAGQMQVSCDRCKAENHTDKTELTAALFG